MRVNIQFCPLMMRKLTAMQFKDKAEHGASVQSFSFTTFARILDKHSGSLRAVHLSHNYS